MNAASVSRIPSPGKPLAKQRYGDILEERGIGDALAAVLRDLNGIPEAKRAAHVLDHVPEDVLTHDAAGSVRAVLPPSELVVLAQRHASDPTSGRTLLREAASAVSKLEPGEAPRKAFWNFAFRHVEDEGFLWEQAPDGIRKNVAPKRREEAPVQFVGGGTRSRERAGPGRGPAPIDVWRSIDWNVKYRSEPIARVVRDAELHARRIRDRALRSECVASLPSEILLFEGANSLRRCVTDRDAVTVFRDYLHRSDATESGLHVIARETDTWELDPALDLWTEILDESRHAESFRARIPKRIAAGLLSRNHATYVGDVRAVEPFDRPDGTEIFADELYRLLGENDRALAARWAGPAASDYETAKMLSARAAELAAARFYRSLGFEVEDIAIRQVADPASQAWRTHDLSVRGHGPVDVKNARTAANSSGRYSEHTIPAFKEARRGEDVIVAGVRSPYLKLDEIAQTSRIPAHRDDPIVVLGECSRRQLGEMRTQFLTPELEDVSIGASTAAGMTRTRVREVLPPWIFTYPDRYYEHRNVVQYRDQVSRVLAHDPPALSELRHLALNPLPFYLQSGVLPEAWRAEMPSWQLKLAERILAHVNGSLPRLFLTLLTDFLAANSQDRAGYTPGEYRRFAFPRMPDDAGAFAWHRVPLGIADPLVSIASLIRTLEILWQHRERSRLAEFTRFRFSGVGLLRGARERGERLTTILAYCGGRTQKHGPCGNAPLVLGLHDACDTCGYLICDKCGYCMSGCSQCEARQGTWSD